MSMATVLFPFEVGSGGIPLGDNPTRDYLQRKYQDIALAKRLELQKNALPMQWGILEVPPEDFRLFEEIGMPLKFCGLRIVRAA
jgi:hypothetical protein